MTLLQQKSLYFQKMMSKGHLTYRFHGVCVMHTAYPLCFRRLRRFCWSTLDWRPIEKPIRSFSNAGHLNENLTFLRR